MTEIQNNNGLREIQIDFFPKNSPEIGMSGSGILP